MQNDNDNQNLISHKQEYLKLLYEKYNAAYTQLGTTLNASEKPSIQQIINNLEEEIKKVGN